MAVDIAILTEQQYVNATPGEWYIDQIILENKILIDALEAEGLSAEKVAWNDESIDWSNYKIILFREVWDYFHKFEAFTEFLDKIQDHQKVMNPIDQIRWNMDKHYLNDLKDGGIHVPETYFIEKSDTRSLKELHEELGWTKTVLKPCVSGGGRHTYLLDAGNLDEHEEIFSQVISNEAMMLQPFQFQIMTKGEVSHMVFHGKYTHSVLKKAKSGDYRVQDDFGGSVHEYQATDEEIRFAESVAAACTPLPKYARIDVFWDNEDLLTIGEVELIEPELWFREAPESATVFAKGLKELI